MTTQRHLKRRVRERMERTGETYATARRHVVGLPEARQSAEPFLHFPGSIPAATALRVLAANAGVVAPHTGEPLSEAMALGLAGGVGAGMFTFRYEAEDFSSFFVAGRHLWQDDLGFLQRACARLGLETRVEEASGAGPALAKLEAVLEQCGPAVAWVDAAHLPYRGMPAAWSGGAYHVLVVYRVDRQAGTALVGDLADRAIELPLESLAQARARIKKDRHRVLGLGRRVGGGELDLARAVREGVTACVHGLTDARMKNFTLEAFRTWGERLHGDRSKDGWERLFPPGRSLWDGLTSIHQFVEHYGTGGGLVRPLYGEFLAEAGEALGDPRFAPVAERYAELGRGWAELAEAALPDEVPAFREAKELHTRKSKLFLEEGAEAGEQIAAVWRRLEELRTEAGECFPVSEEHCDALRRELQRRVLELYDGERAALGELAELATGE
ncbi:MAG TPA: DUF4872 domain-containing protein [Thermoanaerobaculia bacterium]|nr:DUF4872 domain-containing protein [Thermoanaerobaculia bacterium]